MSVVIGGWQKIALLTGLLMEVGCHEVAPIVVPDSGAIDTAIEWAHWPPREGLAGWRLRWVVEGAAPTEQACEDVDLGRMELQFVHPLVDFRTWPDPPFGATCVAGSIEQSSAQGLAPGRYRYRVRMFHLDDSPFMHDPTGEVVFLEHQITPLPVVSITEANK